MNGELTDFGGISHAFATNAIKHGALSLPTGRVSVSWQVEEAENGSFTFFWSERGAPPITIPETKGFGAHILHLMGTVSLDFGACGLDYKMTVPISEVTRRPQ